MGAVIVANRYVPRPPQDTVWDRPPSRSIPENFLPVGGGFPFKNRRFAFNYNDAAVWYRNGSSFSALRLPVAAAAAPFTPNGWAFKGSETPALDFWKYQQSGVNSALGLVGGNFPFVPATWSFKGVDQPVWNFWKYQQSGGNNLLLVAAAPAPFVPSAWLFKGTDYPAHDFWKYQQSGVNSVLGLVGGNFPFVNDRWALDHQTEPVWQNASVPVPPVNRLVGGNFPFVPHFWTAYDEAPVFYGHSFSVPQQLLPAIAPAPFVPSRWDFDHVPTPEWVGKSWPSTWVLDQSFQLFAPATVKPYPVGDEPGIWSGTRNQVNNRLLSQVVVAPFTPPVWRHYYDEAPTWYARSTAVSEVYLPTLVTPLTPSRWKFDNDDGAVWFTKPGSINDVFMPQGGNFPFVPVRWRFDNNDASLWTVQSFAKPDVQGLVNGNNPIRPTFWGYNNDDASTWRGYPANVSIVQQLVVAAPLLPHAWLQDYDQPAFWVGSPTDVPITITQPLPPVVPPEPEFDIPPVPFNSPAGDIVRRKKKKKKHVEPPPVIRRAVYERIIEKHGTEKVEDALEEEEIEVKAEPPGIGSLADLAPAPLPDAKAALKRKQQEEEEIALILLGFK